MSLDTGNLSHKQFMRYSRHLLMDDIGEAGQQKLANARVLIVGLGGLGCPVALYLAAAGVGELGLCDPDTVELSNLQRQILYKEADCGELKVSCAKRELSALNPHLQINSYADKVSAEILSNNFDIVVDCTDNLAARQLINQHCVARKKPLSAPRLWVGKVNWLPLILRITQASALTVLLIKIPRNRCSIVPTLVWLGRYLVLWAVCKRQQLYGCYWAFFSNMVRCSVMMVSQGAGLIYTLKQNRIVMSVVDHCAVVLNARTLSS